MRRTVIAIALAFSSSGAQKVEKPNVEFEMMTWPEVKAAMAEGKTTALFYTGGTEQRGPQNVNGGHTLMGRVIVRTIAQKLGNAIAMPVIPFTPNNASADLPGTIGLTPEILGALLDRMAREAIKTGFKNVVFMQDHGGGSNVYREVATKLDAEFAPQGIHVWYCDDAYVKAGADFDKWLQENGYPSSSHAGIPDTSVMLYLGAELGWVRLDQLATAVGTPVRARGAPRDTTLPRINNGITGDARRSSKDLGKKLFDIKVDYAVKQIRGFMGQ